ncbi:MAG: acyltransferase family protein [Candidatus Bathyarchaeota archaeon]|nr:acyltransferase family protein [Candidatus Bathyarchaeota archaeon]
MADTNPDADPSTATVQKKAGIPVDLIRSVGIFLVILLHVSIQPVPVPSNISATTAWWAFDFYNSIARPCVPLFVMLSGYLLLQPSKVNEPLKVFFKKRWKRIGLPFLFWGIVYFVWTIAFDGVTLSFDSAIQSLLQGPYITFWYLYMLVGLYLLTPLLRVFMAYAGDHILEFVLAIWFIGTGIVPLAGLMGLNLNGNVFILPGWIGYFLFGGYLPRLKTKIRSWKLYGLMALGLAWTMIGSAYMVIDPGPQLYFFFDYLTANVIIVSVSLFILLSSISVQSLESRPSWAKRLVRLVGQNSLPIYLFHMLLLEAFQNGLFGFNLTIMTFNPVIMTPLLAVIILFLSVGFVALLKKVPYLKRFIG